MSSPFADLKGRKKLLFIAMVTSPFFLAIASLLPPFSYVLQTILSTQEKNISFPLAGLWLTWIGIGAIYSRFCDTVVGAFWGIVYYIFMAPIALWLIFVISLSYACWKGSCL